MFMLKGVNAVAFQEDLPENECTFTRFTIEEN